MFPRTHRQDLEAVLVNTGGGLTGGDRFDVSAHIEPSAELTLTTQAAERAYRAQPGEVARVHTTLTVAEKARLTWVPQELILFDQAALDRRLDITLAADAQALMVEPVVFGRAAMGETLSNIQFQDRIRIWRDDRLVYLDGLGINGPATAHLARPAMGGGSGAMVSLVLVAQTAAQQLETVRALLPETGGASMLAPDILVMRLVAPDSFEMRRALIPILDRLTNNRLPLSWRL